jgi:hypothetical protein
MKEILERLEAAIARGNAADEAWEKEPDNPALAEEFDAAYRGEFEVRRELAAAITEASPTIDYDTAFKMTYNPKLAELIKGMA